MSSQDFSPNRSAEPSRRVPVVRRREVERRPGAVERKLKADVDAWLRQRRERR